jgi:release factor glutamine methyltransferase
MKYNTIALIHNIARDCACVYENPEEQEQVAWWLLEKLTGMSKTALVTQQEIIIPPAQEKTLREWIQEHTKHNKPLQYILGWVPFCDLEIIVEPPILIPRPETEEWCTALIEQLKKIPTQELAILDLCTGSGCIALALAAACKQATIVATDISTQALSLARKNARANKSTNVTFIHSNLYDAIPADLKFDIIVANPPYIAFTEWGTLPVPVKEWEDVGALCAENNGTAIIQQIIDQAHRFLRIDSRLAAVNIPQLIIEIGYSQGPIVQKLMQQAGFDPVVIQKDLEGKDRVVKGELRNATRTKNYRSQLS